MYTITKCDNGDVVLEKYSESSFDELNKVLSKVNIIEHAIFNHTDLEEIVIPNHIKQIGGDAFMGCNKLRKVTLGRGLTEISSSCFEGCTSLEEIVIPEGVEVINAKAFKGCKQLRNVTFPSTLKVVLFDAFAQCPVLTSVKIPMGTVCANRAFDTSTQVEYVDYNKSQIASQENDADEHSVTSETIIDRMIRHYKYTLKIDEATGTDEKTIEEYKENIQLLEDLRDGKIEL